MKIVLKGTLEEVRAQVLALAETFEGAEGQAAPTPIANGKPRGRAAAKAPVDTTAAAGAQPPAPPSPAQPAGGPKQMVPLCTTHAGLVDKSKITPIPSEPGACVRCQENIAAGGKPATMDQVKAVAQAMMDSRADGEDMCWTLLQKFGAESVTGNGGTKALDPAQYEPFMKDCAAATVVAQAPARRAL